MRHDGLAHQSPPTRWFKWMGTDRLGVRGRGVVSAPGRAAAHVQLQRQGWIDVHLRRCWRPVRPASISTAQTASLLRQCAALLRAGVPMLRSLDVLRRQYGSHALGGLAQQLGQDVSQGFSLSAAMGRCATGWDPTTRHLVSAAERCGSLETVLTLRADDLERMLKLRGKLLSALGYPMLVLGVAVAVLVMILLWVVPAFGPLYQGLSAPLPLATQALLLLSNGLIQHGVMLLSSLCAAAALVVWLWQRMPELRARFMLHLPMWGTLLRQAAAARWCHTMATLLQAGVPHVEALQSAASSCGHAHLQAVCWRWAQAVAQGHALSQVMGRSNDFPEVVVQLVSVGEEADAVGPMIRQAGRCLDELLEDQAQRIQRQLEPTLTLATGVLVGAAVTALYWPLFTLGAAV